MTTITEDVPELAVVLHLPPRRDAVPAPVTGVPGKRGGTALVVLGQLLLLLGAWLELTADAADTAGRGAGITVIGVAAALTVTGIALRLRADLDRS
ncbi:MAG TPA: hypothetical protein VF109_08235 [Mycobacteriales bacterium]